MSGQRYNAGLSTAQAGGLCLSGFSFLRLMITLLLSFLFSGISFSQNISFGHITINEGLSQNSVYFIYQDHKGFLWFGTQDGLNRYDGSSITVFRNDPYDSTSISSNYITSICEDEEGFLWIGTLGGGLNRFNSKDGSFTAFRHNPRKKNSLSNDHIWVIAKDPEENVLWIGTKNGFNRFDINSGKFTHYYHDSKDPGSISLNEVLAILPSPDGILWLGTSAGGLNRFDKKLNKFTVYKHTLDPNSLSFNNIWSIVMDKDGELWIGTDRGGLDRFNPAAGKFIHYRDDPAQDYQGNYYQGNHYSNTDKRYSNKQGSIRSISNDRVQFVFCDRDGIIWAGTRAGLNVINKYENSIITLRHNELDPKSLSDDIIWAVSQSRDGCIWIGTQSGGVNKYHPLNNLFEYYSKNPLDKNSLSGNNIYSIFEDHEGLLWIGTRGAGLNRLDPHINKYTHYRYSGKPGAISDDNVRVVFEDRDLNLWIGTNAGLNRLRKEDRGRFIHYKHDPASASTLSHNQIHTIAQDSYGILWVGTANGLNRFDYKNNIIERIPGTTLHRTGINFITSLLPEGDSLWVGTSDGLCIFNLTTGKLVRVFTHDMKNPSTISHNYIYSLIRDSKGVLWVGTYQGLNRFDRKNNSFEAFTSGNGLANDLVFGIVEDEKGYLWLSTVKGISRFKPETGEIKNFDINTGLQHNEFNYGAYFKSRRSGKLFFGGINGLTAFLPGNISHNTHQPDVVITSVKQFDKPVSNSIDYSDIKEIRLDYDENFISFEFAALDFVNPGSNQFAYRLAGLDERWHFTNHLKLASYTNLDPGEYTFQVIASNNDGVWNRKGTALRLIISPPFWQTGWFRFLLILSFLFLTAAIVRLRNNKFAAQRKQLEKELEIANQSERLKSEFLAQMSHEIRTPINNILNYISLLKEECSAQFNSDAPFFFKVIDNAGKRIIRTTDLILNMSEIQTGQFKPKKSSFNIDTRVYQPLLPEFRNAAEEKGIDLKFNEPPENPLVLADEYAVTQIFINLVDNAIKYTEKGCVTINTGRTTDGKLSVRIIDTGIGISPEFMPNLFKAFSQEQTGYTRKYEGNGLGLALVKKYCELNDISISVESRKGEGTVFTLVFNS